MKAAVLAGGRLEPSERLRQLVADAELLVAADSGVRHAAALGRVPDLIVGDFDSATAEQLEPYPDVPQLRHPPDKDELDLELAITAARARGADELLLVAALGGRFDQSLAAVLIAARLRREGVRVVLASGDREVLPLVAGDRVTLPAPDGTLFSLLALTGAARVSLAGARYPLDEAELPFGVGLGVSNAVAGGPARIAVHAGLVLVVIEWKEPSQDARQDAR